MKVLVIEDDQSVRETLGIVLETYHYDVHLAKDGEQAIAYLKNDWPDLMLLDLSLERMTGEEVFAKVQQLFGAVPPTVVLSAVSHGEKRISKMPGARFLAKPYTLDQLIAVLQETYKPHPAA